MSSATKRRLLLVTSSYAPVTMADMHRVRHLAWELPKQGWGVEVFAPNAEFKISEYQEPGSEPLFNPEFPCHEFAQRDFWVFHLFNMRSIGCRALWPMARAGVRS